MDLATYMRRSRGNWPKKGAKPVASEWLEFCQITLPTGTLWAGDPWIMNADDGTVVKVPEGTYVVEAKGMDFAGHRRVAAVRAYLKGAPVFHRTRGRRETGTDSAMIALCDIRTLGEHIDDVDAEAFQDRMMKDCDGDCGLLHVKFNRATLDIAYTSSGLGDGGFPAFPLKDGKKTIGVEVVFLGPELEGWEEMLAIKQLN